MFVNKFMLNMLSENVLGIPIVAKLGKKDSVKSIYSIPYRTIAQYLSNIRGYVIGESYAVKSPSLARLIKYSEDFEVNDWYSVEAVKVFFDIEFEDDIDKNIVAWYNPYMQTITQITDAYKNPIEKPQSVINQILEKYLAKNSGDKPYFVDIYPAQSQKAINYDAANFFLAKSSIAKKINFFKAPALQIDHEQDPLFRPYYSLINDIPKCRFMECVLLACFEKSLFISYALSDNDGYYAHQIYDLDTLLRMPHLTRMKVALDLFYKNSILAFKALVEVYGDTSGKSIGKSILREHFTQADINKDDWVIYTDSLYRLIALCIGFYNSNSAISLIVKNSHWGIFSFSGIKAYNTNTNAMDAMIGWEKAFLASWLPECFVNKQSPQLPLTGTCPYYNYNAVTNFVSGTINLFKISPYVAFNGDIMAYYNKGKEFYSYACGQ